MGGSEIGKKSLITEFISQRHCDLYGLRPLQKSPSFDSRDPNTGFRLFSPPITPDFTQIPP
ncbi:MAG: hypothetical protein D8H97_09030 [Neisseria sp.]|nr:MAG: hypothetical protein D8H97_09030 [Neisseria sp.]